MATKLPEPAQNTHPTDDIHVQKLCAEYLENPLGIDAREPQLSWQIASSNRGAAQSACQVQTAFDSANLSAGADLLWDSGKVDTDRTAIPYRGPALHSGQRVYWHTRAWDQDEGVSAWSEPAWWEMGLLEEHDWTAEWVEVGWDEDPNAFKPSPYLRRGFKIDAPVKSARLYVTAHGLYEAWLNGQRVGDQLFTPGYTPYDKMLQYQAYDVTDVLQQGENALGAILGDGWYRGQVYVTSTRNVYGARLGLLALLRIETSDGNVIIGTDSGWKCSTGPILMSDMKAGEIYDARLEMGEDSQSWCSPSFEDSAWKPVRVTAHDKSHLVASMGVPVRRKETFHPKIIKTPKGETVLDFGQNLAGVVHFKVRGEKGTTIRLRHGEALDEHGNFTTAHLVPDKNTEKVSFQEVRYTLKGSEVEEYEPHFTVHGFQYVKVEGYPGEIHPEDFYSVAIYSDMPVTGTFTCSDPLINQLHHNTIWSMKSNYLDLPTDCPQRERAGWTGDAQIFTPSASFLMDTRAFFRKWLAELRIEQRADGMMGNFVPNPYRLKKTFLNQLDGSCGWGDVTVLMPWYIYQAYGEQQILESQYESMCGWVEYMQRRASEKTWLRRLTPRYLFDTETRSHRHLLWDTNYHWGEWLEPGDGDWLRMASGVIGRVLFGSPVVATAYFAYSTRILAQVASLLGKDEDAAKYHDLADEVKAAYIAEFIGKDGRMQPDRQASYARALAFDLVTDDLKPLVLEHLVRLVRESGCHIGTGFLTTPLLCHVLQENGRLDLAYEILNQKTIPSWLYEVTKGATTIWEAWEGIKPDGSLSPVSLNHYSPGAVVDFLHRKVAGIAPAEPGYRCITIHPMPGGGLTSARATYESVHGLIVSAWKIENGRMTLDVTIPANTRATVTLPGAALNQVTESDLPLALTLGVSLARQAGADCLVEVGSGSYHFAYPIL
jgi:alpha-L-rhamnosidase